jgi:class 3 adenylate cyclase/tetratricopeptide (TPR) repeat protein
MQQIADWLRKLGMSEYAERFAENDIDASVLPELTDQDLKDLGVSLGHRRKMLRAIRDLGDVSVAVTASPAPVAAEPARREDAERRQLTVMFTDLVGSTALSTKLDPEDMRLVIGAYHKCVAETVARFDGFVAKYMGDGVLVYFGYPHAHEDDAERAVRAALNLVEAVPKLAMNAGSPLQVRVGIATGLVVVGDLIGSGAAQEQAVVGETPNLAARLQALAEPGAVVIGSGARRLTGGLFEYRDLGAFELKGFAENVPAWQVLREGAAESRFEALRVTTTPLVGRDEEIDLLMRRWEQAKQGEGCVVLISGEPGIGKSRIAQIILERLSGEPHTRLRYFCSPHHQDSALYPSITQLERAAGFRRGDSDARRLDKLEAVLAQGSNDLSEVVPLLADLLSIPTADRYLPLNLAPRKRKEKTLSAQLAQVEGLAAQHPVLMVWEDVHWSDPSTRESIDLLIERVPALRVLVIITFRPEFTPPWIGRPHVTMLTLNRLPARQCVEMIAQVTGGKSLPKEIAEQIVDRTDGVPLFIEELTKSIVESALVAEAEDRYVATGRAAPLTVPTTLHASLLARLDRLAPTREVAQIAAALGRRFSYELISAVAQMPRHQVDDALAQLVRAELVFRRGTPPDAEYTFKHALVQDTAYSTLLRGRRVQLHARIAATLEDHFPEIVASQPALVAQHFAEAEQAEQAIGYWLKAGQQAVARSAMREAETLLRKGLNQLSGLGDSLWRQELELDLQIALGRVLFQIQGFHAQEAAQAHSRARRLCDELKRPNKLLPILYGLWVNCFVGADLNRARQFATEMLDLGELRDDVVTRVVGCRAIGGTNFYSGDFPAARERLERGLELYDPAETPLYGQLTSISTHVALLGYLSPALACLGHLDQARLRFDEALAEAREVTHAPTLAHILWQGPWCAGWCARFEPLVLLRYADELLTLSADRELAFWHKTALMCRGWCLAALGNSQQGISLLTDVLDDHRPTSNGPLALTLLADACRILGQPGIGLKHLAEAEDRAVATQVRWLLCETLRMRGDLLLLAGDRVTAEASFRDAIALARRQSAKTFELRACASLARLWRDQGKRAEARDLLAPIYGWFTEGFDTPVLQDAKALLDQLA